MKASMEVDMTGTWESTKQVMKLVSPLGWLVMEDSPLIKSQSQDFIIGGSRFQF